MPLFGFIALALGSAAGGAALTAGIAASFATDLFTVLMILTLGALAGSALGWSVLKARGALLRRV